MISNPIFFHIGYHRTGTTFLQRSVFRPCGNKIILSLNYNELDFLLKFFTWPDLIQLNEESFTEKVTEMVKSRDEGIPVVASAEGLSGTIFTDNFEIPKKIHKLFPNARIIMCLRSQVSIMPSMYHIYIKDGGRYTYSEFIEELIRNNKFDYFKLLTHYQEIFGSENVLPMIFEDLKEDEAAFIAKVINFIGVDVEIKPENKNEHYKNQRSDLPEQRARLLVNNFANGIFWKINPNLARRLTNFLARCLAFLNKKGLYSPKPMIDDDKSPKIILENYRESNDKLFKLLNRENIYNVD